MSGGSLNYVYQKLEEASYEIQARSKTAIHRAFSKHLLKVSKALYNLEWVLSGDKEMGSEIKSINEVMSSNQELSYIVEEAELLLKELEESIKKTKKE